ncbi:MAG: hypothetical protein IJA82_07225 [Clostridia bacterium]|nr:hypothetical protein [Clostridia bacterium]
MKEITQITLTDEELEMLSFSVNFLNYLLEKTENLEITKDKFEELNETLNKTKTHKIGF